MHIVLDLQACQSPESGRRGIGRYSLALAKAMARNPRGHRISLLLNAAMGESIEFLRTEFEYLVPERDVIVWNGLSPSAFVEPDNAFRRRASELLRLDALRRAKPDVVHVASLFEGVADEVTGTISRDDPWVTAVTLYDLIPLVQQDVYLADPRINAWYMEKLGYLKQADQLLGISAFSCAEAKELLCTPDECLTDISGAADAIFTRLPDAESYRGGLMARYGIEKPFIMYAGGFDARKNIAGLIRAFAGLPVELRDAHQLVIVGGAPAPEKAALQKVVEESGLTVGDVLFTGFVPDSELVKFYNLCALYVFASLQEGFGLPALEAMSSGAVVIGSNTSSLPEVIGFKEALFDPRDDAAISAAMQVALIDQGFRQRFLDHAQNQSQGFSWGKSARRALEGIELAWARGSNRHQASNASMPSSAVDAGRDRFEVTDNASGAKAIKSACEGVADLVVSDQELGGALEALAKTERRLVLELAYHAAGYAGVHEVMAAGFSAKVLGGVVPVQTLMALGQSQIVHPPSIANPWRDEVETMVLALHQDVASAMAGEQDWARVAVALAAQQPRIGDMPRWYVDISNLAIHDAGTGIQRVVRHVLDELMASPPAGYRVEPVYMDDAGVFRHARTYCSKRYFKCEDLPPDDVVDMRGGDVFLGLDLIAHLVPRHRVVFERMRNIGVKVHFVVYDLLPILRQDCFEPHLLPYFRAWYESIAMVADGIICISRSVADEFEYWLHQSRPERLRPLNIGWFHLGADLALVSSAEHAASTHGHSLEALGERPTFLMVGTVEPRKGHAQALSAFESLWKGGVDANLLIIGKPGWMTEALVERLRTHPMRGSRLFWFEKAGDDVLLAAYGRASALLNPSEGEGFGLPLIEAAHHGVPLIIRDLPVFREIVGENAVYFSGYEPEAIAVAVQNWIELDACGQTPQSSNMTWLTWAQATHQLVSVIAEGRWIYQWLPGTKRIFSAHDYRFSTQVGNLVRGEMVSTGQPGFLLYGPYQPLPAGRYLMDVCFKGHARGWIDVCSQVGGKVHVRQEFDLERSIAAADAGLLQVSFELACAIEDMEIRIMVEAGADIRLECIVLHGMDGDVPMGADAIPVDAA